MCLNAQISAYVPSLYMQFFLITPEKLPPTAVGYKWNLDYVLWKSLPSKDFLSKMLESEITVPYPADQVELN